MLREKDELDLFRVTLQQLELCRELILDGTEAKWRVALILLDNISEIILYRVVKDELAKEDFIRSVVRERFPPKQRRAIDRFFWAKLEVVADIRHLPEPVCKALTILHSYRNAAFHRDTHNPAVLPILARVAFVAVADLFARTHAGMHSSAIGGYSKPIEWLQHYGLVGTFVQFDTAAKSIAKQLKAGVRPKLSSVTRGFGADIMTRLTGVREVLNELFPSGNVKDIDRMLKRYEFRRVRAELESKLSERFRALNYKIAAGRGEEVSLDEYVAAETEFHSLYDRQFAKFLQGCKYEDLNKIKNELPLVLSERNFRAALARYAALDAQLESFEQSITTAYHEMEWQAEMERGIARGK